MFLEIILLAGACVASAVFGFIIAIWWITK